MRNREIYFIGRHSHNETRMAEHIKQNEFSEIQSALSQTNLLQQAQMPYLLFKLQFDSFRNRWKQAEAKVSEHESFHFSNKYRTLIDFTQASCEVLFGFRQYLDTTAHQLSAIYGANSILRNSFELYTNILYDAHFEYRLAEQLRNFAQHYLLPVSSISATVHAPESGLISERQIILSKSDLLAWRGLKKTVRSDINMLTGDIRLYNVLEQLKDYATSLFSLLLNYFRIHNWAIILKLNQLLDRIGQEPGVACIGHLIASEETRVQYVEIPETLIRVLKTGPKKMAQRRLTAL